MITVNAIVLYIVTALPTSTAPGNVVSMQGFATKQQCERALKVSTEGLKHTFAGNANHVAAEMKVEVENGWTTVRTGVGRVVASLKCD